MIMNSNDMTLKNSYKYYTFLAMFYVIVAVTAQAMGHRMLQIGPFTLPGGIFIFPLIFIINDIIAEVYGPTLARRSIFYALIVQSFFSFAPALVNTLPYPSWWHDADAYQKVFHWTGLVYLANIASIITGMVLNTQIIAKTKILAKGRYFFLRSLLSSTIGELIQTAIIVAIAFVPVRGVNIGLELFVNMFLFKMMLSILFVIPASFIARLLKRVDHADVYETDTSFNPLHFFTKRNKLMLKQSS